MKKSLLAIILVGLMLVIAACGNNNAANTNSTATGNAEAPTATPEVKEVTLKVGASPVPHAEILKEVAPILKEQGVNLEIIEFTDYVLPNQNLEAKEIDANFFQHVPYLEDQNATRGFNLVSVAGIHVEPFGIYSNKIKSIDELEDGAKIAIPNDPTNGGRSLLLLAQNGLIELDDNAGTSVTVAEIKANPHNFQFVELEAATLPRVLDEVAVAAINTNYALEAGLNPVNDALLLEDSTSPYVNIIVTREDNKDAEAIQKLVAALQTPEIEKFINEKYEGAIVPAFTK